MRVLTACGQMTPYGVIDLGLDNDIKPYILSQIWLMGFCRANLWPISLTITIDKMSLKNALAKLLHHLSGKLPLFLKKFIENPAFPSSAQSDISLVRE